MQKNGGGIKDNHKKILNNQCPSQESNWAPSKYKSELLLLRQLA
jgi:hypothetical protein